MSISFSSGRFGLWLYRGQVVFCWLVVAALITGAHEPLRRALASRQPAAQRERNQIAEFAAPSMGKPAAVGDVINSYSVTSAFGYRNDPFTGERRFHGGVDVALPEGTRLYPIAPPRSSVKVECGHDPGGWGKFARYTTASGEVVTLAHVSLCSEGRMGSGSAIARSGNTGRSTAPHLHAEIQSPGGQKRSMTVEELWITLRGAAPKPVLRR